MHNCTSFSMPYKRILMYLRMCASVLCKAYDVCISIMYVQYIVHTALVCILTYIHTYIHAYIRTDILSECVSCHVLYVR